MNFDLISAIVGFGCTDGDDDDDDDDDDDAGNCAGGCCTKDGDGDDDDDDDDDDCSNGDGVGCSTTNIFGCFSKVDGETIGLKNGKVNGLTTWMSLSRAEEG